MPDARCTRGLVCKIVRKKLHTSIQGSGEHPTFPAQGSQWGEESLVKSMQWGCCVQFCVTSRCHQAAERNIAACEVLWSCLPWEWLPTEQKITFELRPWMPQFDTARQEPAKVGGGYVGDNRAIAVCQGGSPTLSVVSSSWSRIHDDPRQVCNDNGSSYGLA